MRKLEFGVAENEIETLRDDHRVKFATIEKNKRDRYFIKVKPIDRTAKNSLYQEIDSFLSWIEIID